MLSDKFVILAVAINIVGGFTYMRATVIGEAQPNRITWGLWALPALIAFAAEIHQGVGLQSLITLMVGVGPLILFLSSFFNKKSLWKLGRLDYICGGLSILGLVLWLITNQGNLAIMFGILADAFAAIPTIVKSYKHPESESAPVYLLGAIAAGVTMLTIKDWNLANYGFPAYILILGLTLFGLIKFKLGKKFEASRVK